MQTCMFNLYSDEKGNDDEIEDAGTSGKEGGQPWIYFRINSSQLRNC